MVFNNKGMEKHKGELTMVVLFGIVFALIVFCIIQIMTWEMLMREEGTPNNWKWMLFMPLIPCCVMLFRLVFAMYDDLRKSIVTEWRKK